MNDTKLNPLYNALDGIDEDIAASVLIKKRKPAKKILLLSVAAAAVLLLLTGFTIANKNFGVRFGNGSNERGFYLNVTSQKFTVPEEFKERGNYFFDYVDIFPSKLFPKFGITMLTNDNFTDVEETGYKHRDNGHADWAPHLTIDIIDEDFITVEIRYFLYDKNVDKPIQFKAKYISDIDRTEYSAHYKFNENVNAEIITLNDGSLCLVSNYNAVFAYNGVSYEITDANYGGEGHSEFYKQVLVDLGIYTPTVNTN